VWRRESPRRSRVVTRRGGMGGTWRGPIIDPASDFCGKTFEPVGVIIAASHKGNVMPWVNVTLWRWGDIATWVGAAVNFAVVLVALSPIRAAKRERAARGRLVAASLHVQMKVVHRLLELAANSMTTLLAADSMPEGPHFGHLVGTLREVQQRVPPLLACFSIPEAAYLDREKGERLARTVGSTNAAMLGLSTLLNELDAATQFNPTGGTRSARKKMITSYKFLADNLHTNFERMGEFTAYCDSLFLSATKDTSDKVSWVGKRLRPIRGVWRRRGVPLNNGSRQRSA